ncbi:U6 small nuclear RNA (adenine-(43)-N(6))-methyltransferase [Cylas formicarius]|uniref:U6 small nuclear RNA (adenine-(43)-N(6))-methyltransferase n=1 Tax=Cylas formicarius TaxID=197179 RepID=UPI0029589E86|nr:U6 small nuclear RNA (adenine-(43)-N(6))-methyltransferase [Cylas formicarius]
MSMNKYMHPRNIYKKPPDFQQLALGYPEFRKYVKLDICGKVSFDFKDPDSLRVLSRTLLKKDFGLDVQIPREKLVPTIPLRLNYILWMEDLLDFMQLGENIKGIDIGTGASCVYPLIAAKKNNWSMVGTEIDEKSVSFAKKNVESNKLSSLITIVRVQPDTFLKGAVGNDPYDFCMCNPPFFSSFHEVHPFFKSRKIDRPRPKNAFVATANEVVSKGGEVEFIKHIIKESKELGDQLKLCSSMVGHKSSLPHLKAFLRELEVRSFKETEFCQGNTTRWGLAWTFCNFDLRKATDVVKLVGRPVKKHHPMFYFLPVADTGIESVNKVTVRILNIFKTLRMTFEEVTRNKSHQRFFVTALFNTWSHQRRKKREKMRKSLEGNDTNSIQEEPIQTEVKSPGKRVLDDLCDGTFTKKLKINGDNHEAAVFYKFLFGVSVIGGKIALELNTVDGFDRREYLNQILQYIKNNLRDEVAH